MKYTLNLANMPSTLCVDFIVWIGVNKIGNYQGLYRFIALDEAWYFREHIPFECSEPEASIIVLKWS